MKTAATSFFLSVVFSASSFRIMLLVRGTGPPLSSKIGCAQVPGRTGNCRCRALKYAKNKACQDLARKKGRKNADLAALAPDLAQKVVPALLPVEAFQGQFQGRQAAFADAL